VSFGPRPFGPNDIIQSGVLNYCVGFGTFKCVLDSVSPRKSVNYYLARKRHDSRVNLGFWRFAASISNLTISDDDLEKIFRFRCDNPRITSTWADVPFELNKLK